MKRVIVTLKGSVLQRLQKNHGVAARLVQRSQWPHERVKKKKKSPWWWWSWKEVAGSGVPPAPRTPASELRRVARSSPASSNARLSHPSLLYHCTASAAEEGRWLGERRVLSLSQSLPRNRSAPAAAGSGRDPKALPQGAPRPPLQTRTALRGESLRQPLGVPAPRSHPPPPPGTPGRVPALGGFSPAERGTRVREVHCSPIKQLTGKRMGRPPPLWLPKPLAMGKVAGTEIPFFPPLCLPDLSGGCNERICW